jgi:mRNA interferase MazF
MPLVPERGDIVWLVVDPQAGHEQSDRRPAIVLSPASYNGRTNLALVCPVTSKVKAYPFEVALPSGLPVTGVVLADQVKSLDWRARQAEVIGQVPPETLRQIQQRLLLLLQ